MSAGGIGSLYKRGETWWLSIRHNGRKIQESCKTGNEAEARKVLAEAVARIQGGNYIAASKAPTFETVWALLIEDYKAHGRKTLRTAEHRYKRLVKFFGGRRVHDIDESAVIDYRSGRLGEGAKPATVNRELSALARAMRLGRRLGAVVPPIEKLTERNTRRNWITRAQFEALRAELPDYLQTAAGVAYITGWRLSELFGMRWPQVDFEGDRLLLEPGATKNDDGRMFSLAHAELRDLLEAQRACVSAIEHERGVIVPWVFCHGNGTPIKNHYAAWDSACLRAGVDGAWFHDFRRAAIRNLIAAGIPRSVAMAMVGHKTESIFRRYAIVTEPDMHAAARQLAAHHDREKASGAAAKVVSIKGARRKAVAPAAQPTKVKKQVNE